MCENEEESAKWGGNCEMRRKLRNEGGEDWICFWRCLILSNPFSIGVLIFPFPINSTRFAAFVIMPCLCIIIYITSIFSKRDCEYWFRSAHTPILAQNLRQARADMYMATIMSFPYEGTHVIGCIIAQISYLKLGQANSIAMGSPTFGKMLLSLQKKTEKIFQFFPSLKRKKLNSRPKFLPLDNLPINYMQTWHFGGVQFLFSPCSMY